MALVIKKNDKNSRSDLFSLILTSEILKHCNDYKTLKTIQMSTTALNDLFTCPSQAVWKQLCHKNKYSFLLRKEAKCLWKRSILIWESIYYQNWKVDFNWNTKKYEIVDLSKMFKDGLMKMVNAYLSISIPIEIDGILRIWDLKRGILLDSRKVKGLVTSSCLQGNLLVLGKVCGSMTVLKIFCNLEEEKTMKHHSKEISSIVIDIKNGYIISADIGGQIIRSSLIDSVPVILYHSSSGSGVTSLILKKDYIFATSMDSSLIKVSIQNKEFKKWEFKDCGSINCMTTLNSIILMGTDSGTVLMTNKGKVGVFETTRNSPIISIAANSKRVSVGHFDGTVTVFTHKNGILEPLFVETQKNKGAIWSLAMDEISLVSCALNGEIILRNFL